MSQRDKAPAANETDPLAEAGGFVCRPLSSLPARLRREPPPPAAADGEYEIFRY